MLDALGGDATQEDAPVDKELQDLLAGLDAL
jgi:hypothetical protein